MATQRTETQPPGHDGVRPTDGVVPEPGGRAAMVDVMIVGDGTTESAYAATVARRLVPRGDFEIVATVAPTANVYDDATGFAGPIMTEAELSEIARERRVDAMGATAATARGLGSTPATYTTVEGEPIEAITAAVAASHPDIVVVAASSGGTVGADRPIAAELVERLSCPVIVVPSEHPF